MDEQPFFDDVFYASAPVSVWRNLSALVHEMYDTLERMDKLPVADCPCVECWWVRREAEDVLHDRA